MPCAKNSKQPSRLIMITCGAAVVKMQVVEGMGVGVLDHTIDEACSLALEVLPGDVSTSL